MHSVRVGYANRKIERAVRKGKIFRYHNNDWFAEAVEKSIITPAEEKLLRETEDLVNRAIAVDHFDPAEIETGFDMSHMETAAAAE